MSCRLVGLPAATAGDLAAIWSPDRSARVRQAFLASGHRLAEDTADRILPRLDAYASGWAAMRVDGCERHRSGQHSDRLFDLGTAERGGECLVFLVVHGG